jgi:hypothetical protein
MVLSASRRTSACITSTSRRTENRDLYTLYGWASAALFVQALTSVAPHPIRGAVLSQLAKITSFNTGGLIAPVNPW